MLFVDYNAIPPFEGKSVIRLKTVDDFETLDFECIDEYQHIIDARECSNAIIGKLKDLIEYYPSIYVFMMDPVPREILSVSNSIVIANIQLTQKAGIIELLLRGMPENNRFTEKVKKVFGKGD